MSTSPFTQSFNQRVDAIDLRLRQIQSGRPVLTGIPEFLNGFTFSDGTLQTSAAGFGGASTITATSPPFSGNGSVGNPLNLKSSSVTLQGNSFNSASQLVKLDANGAMQLLGSATASTGTFTGNAFSVGSSSFSVAGGSATVAYKMTAATFSGDGASVTNITATNIANGTLNAGVRLSAGSLTNGPLASSILPSTVAYTSIQNSFTGPTNTFQLGLVTSTFTATSSVTLNSNQFSIGGSTLTVDQGAVYIGSVTFNTAQLANALGSGKRPSSQFVVTNNPADTGSQISLQNFPGAGLAKTVLPSASFTFRLSSGSALAPVSPGDASTANINFTGYDDTLTQAWATGSYMQFVTSGDWTGGGQYGSWVKFNTTPKGSQNNAERLRIEDGAKVDIFGTATVTSTMSVKGNAFDIATTSFTVLGGSVTIAYNLTVSTLMATATGGYSIYSSSGILMKNNGCLTYGDATQQCTAAGPGVGSLANLIVGAVPVAIAANNLGNNSFITSVSTGVGISGNVTTYGNHIAVIGSSVTFSTPTASVVYDAKSATWTVSSDGVATNSFEVPIIDTDTLGWNPVSSFFVNGLQISSSIYRSHVSCTLTSGASQDFYQTFSSGVIGAASTGYFTNFWGAVGGAAIANGNVTTAKGCWTNRTTTDLMRGGDTIDFESQFSTVISSSFVVALSGNSQTTIGATPSIDHLTQGCTYRDGSLTPVTGWGFFLQSGTMGKMNCRVQLWRRTRPIR